jgi:hypothetical protein
MNVYGSSEEHQPVAWLRGYPLYAAHLIVAGFVVSMIASAILMFAGAAPVLEKLQFTSQSVLRGEVWRVFTYGLVNPPSLWFAIDMLMIVWFGRELEKFFGRRIFLGFFAALYLLSPVVLTVIGLWQPTSLAGQRGAFALFVAFATLHPNAMMILNLLAKWVAVVLIGLQSFIYLSSRDMVGLIVLWVTVGFAYGFVRFQQGHFTVPRFKFRSRKPKLRVLPDLEAKKTAGVRSSNESAMAEIDALLDKIATSGMSSLTPKERAKLDAARDDLLKKSASRR